VGVRFKCMCEGGTAEATVSFTAFGSTDQARHSDIATSFYVGQVAIAYRKLSFKPSRSTNLRLRATFIVLAMSQKRNRPGDFADFSNEILQSKLKVGKLCPQRVPSSKQLATEPGKRRSEGSHNGFQSGVGGNHVLYALEPPAALKNYGQHSLRLALTQGEAHFLISGAGREVEKLRLETPGIKIRIWDTASASGARYCAISGAGWSCWMVLVKMLQALGHASEVNAHRTLPGAAQYDPHAGSNSSLTILKLNSGQTGSLIGRSGATVSKLRSSLCQGASIVVQKDALEMDAAFRNSAIIQSPAHARLAVVRDVLDAALREEPILCVRDTAAAGSTASSQSPAHASAHSTHPAGPHSHMPALVHGATETVAVPSSCIGHVIGKGGTRINSIRHRSTAQIKIAQTAVGGSRIITLSGNKHACAEASSLIQGAIQEALMRSATAAKCAAPELLPASYHQTEEPSQAINGLSRND